jgi:hypothetical protein
MEAKKVRLPVAVWEVETCRCALIKQELEDELAYSIP